MRDPERPRQNVQDGNLRLTPDFEGQRLHPVGTEYTWKPLLRIAGIQLRLILFTTSEIAMETAPRCCRQGGLGLVGGVHGDEAGGTRDESLSSNRNTRQPLRTFYHLCLFGQQSHARQPPDPSAKSHKAQWHRPAQVLPVLAP